MSFKGILRRLNAIPKGERRLAFQEYYGINGNRCAVGILLDVKDAKGMWAGRVEDIIDAKERGHKALLRLCRSLHCSVRELITLQDFADQDVNASTPEMAFANVLRFVERIAK